MRIKVKSNVKERNYFTSSLDARMSGVTIAMATEHFELEALCEFLSMTGELQR